MRGKNIDRTLYLRIKHMCGDKKISKHIVEIHLVNGLGDYLQYTGIYCIYTVGL